MALDGIAIAEYQTIASSEFLTLTTRAVLADSPELSLGSQEAIVLANPESLAAILRGYLAGDAVDPEDDVIISLDIAKLDTLYAENRVKPLLINLSA